MGRQLAKLEPVVWGTGRREKLSLALTPSGRSSQWFSLAKTGIDADLALARLPGFEWSTVIQREKPATIVLAQAIAGPGPTEAAVQISPSKWKAGDSVSSQPAIVQMTYGRGTVVGVLGDGLWRWSLLPPDKQNLNAFYDTFWSNLVRWLSMGGEFSPDQHVALHLSRTTVRLGDPLAVDVVYKHTPATGAHPKLEVTDPAKKRRKSRGADPLAGTAVSRTLKPAKEGVYEVSVEARHAAAPPGPAVQCL